MKTLGFLNPKAGAGQSRLILNLGWVLADAGFRVALIDFDPQAGLTALAGASGEAAGSVYGALALPADATELVELASNLWLVRGHIQASIFDDGLATAWTSSPDPRAVVLEHGIERMIQRITAEHELDVALCDLGASLGPFCHATAAAVDAIVVPLAPRAAEDAAMRSLAQALQRWRAAPSHTSPPDPFPTLGFVIVRSSGAIEIGLEQLASAYHRELTGEHLGTIKEFPSLAGIARNVHKPEIQLTLADGAVGSLASAVLDLSRQYETLATRIVNMAGILDEDTLATGVERALDSALSNDLPPQLDQLSSRTVVEEIGDVELEIIEIRSGGLRVTGTAAVGVELEWGGGERRDGTEASMSFPLRFDIELDRSHESATEVHDLAVDTSSFYE